MKKRIPRYLVGLLLALLLVLGLSVSAFAAGQDSERMRLKEPDTSGNTAFMAENMFPGDAVTKDFTVQVSHKKPISLYYHADIRPGSEKLAEVMMVTIRLPQKGKVLYDGLMRDMPNALEYQLAASEKEVVYQITAYLDTSVGNEYQYKELVADFRWWYMEETDDGDDSGSGGGSGDGGGSGSGDGGGSGSVSGQAAAVSVKLTAEKVLDGEYPRGNDFTFLLTDENGNVLQTVQNRDGLIEFDMLRFDRNGIFTYHISEKPGTDERMFYDDTIYKTIITVEEINGVCTAAVSYEKGGEPYLVLPRFVNETEGGHLAGVWDQNPTIPKTADDSPVALYLMLCFGSLAVCVFLLLLMMKQRKGGKRR